MLYGNLFWCTSGLDTILHCWLQLGPAWNSGSKCNGAIKWCNQQLECLEAGTSSEHFSKFQQNTTTEMKNSPIVHLSGSWVGVGKQWLQQAGSLLAGKKGAAFLNYHCSSIQESCSKCGEDYFGWMISQGHQTWNDPVCLKGAQTYFILFTTLVKSQESISTAKYCLRITHSGPARHKAGLCPAISIPLGEQSRALPCEEESPDYHHSLQQRLSLLEHIPAWKGVNRQSRQK